MEEAEAIWESGMIALVFPESSRVASGKSLHLFRPRFLFYNMKYVNLEVPFTSDMS